MVKLLGGGLKDVCRQEYVEPFYKVVGALEGPGEEPEPRKRGSQKERRLGAGEGSTEEEQVQPPPPPSARDRRMEEMVSELVPGKTGGEL